MLGEIPPKGVEGLQEPAQFDEGYFAETFGLTAAEALQTVSFGEQGSAPFWQVLQDGRCPVGGWIRTAYAEGGREAVESKLTLFNQMAPEFTVAIGEEAKKKVILEQESASIPEETHRTTPDKLNGIEQARVIEKSNVRSTADVTVPVPEIVKQQEITTRVKPKEIELIPTETVTRIKKPIPQTELVKTIIKPEPTQKITTVRALEQKPVPIIYKPEPQRNRTATDPTVVEEQVTKPTRVQMKAESPVAKTHKPTETSYSAIRDAFLPELPDVETHEPTVDPALIDYESSVDDMDTFMQPKTAFEQPDVELLELALPFIEFQQPEQSALEGEYSDTEEIPSVVDQLYQHFETLQPELALEASEILNIIMGKIQELEAEETGEYRETLEQELETICERMLVCMGIEPNPELVKNLLLVLKIEHQEQLELNTQISYDKGTHERKNAVFQSIYSLPLEISQKLFHSLGRHMLILAS